MLTETGGFIVCDRYHHTGFRDDLTRAAGEFMATGRAQRVFKRRLQYVIREIGRG